jgi:tubulin monoglycylase TTLL3/8
MNDKKCGKILEINKNSVKPQNKVEENMKKEIEKTNKFSHKQENTKKEKENKFKSEKVKPPMSKTSSKTNPVDPNQKYYIISGGYQDVVQSLERWGFKESPYPEVFDFNWCLKSSGIDYNKLRKNQIVNHFVGNKEFTSKLGLCKNIRSLVLKDNIDVDNFYPRCYDLEDKLELDDFVEEFKFQKAEGLVKQFTLGVRKLDEQKLIISLNICEKKLNFYSEIGKEKKVKFLLQKEGK